ncbi:MAG: hypothetical protein PHE54_02940 [Bacilli bacterium]|nr:hypothetical protein [Bacilli bacterium]
MNKEQYEQFLYSLKRIAGHIHFLDEVERSIITNFPSLEESGFFEVMIRNARLVKNYHIGIL